MAYFPPNQFNQPLGNQPTLMRPTASNHLMMMHALQNANLCYSLNQARQQQQQQQQMFLNDNSSSTINVPLDFNVEKNQPTAIIGKDGSLSYGKKEINTEKNNRNSDVINLDDEGDVIDMTDDKKVVSEGENSQLQPILTNCRNVPIWPPQLLSQMHFPMMSSNTLESILMNAFVPPVGKLISSSTASSKPSSNQSNSDAVTSPDGLPSVETVHRKTCVLVPPHPDAEKPTTRIRPPGCRTVFVGGLPDNMREDVVADIFHTCGDILTIRMSVKKFCHVRFWEENSVDAAIAFSGYRVRIGGSLDPANVGRIHVDFAHARDDQHEYECKQRQIQREIRHKERQRAVRAFGTSYSKKSSSPSPPLVSHYTEVEANHVLEKLKGEETLSDGLRIAICWLDRGEVNKRNVNTFYNIIQSMNGHVRRLIQEKNKCETDFAKAKNAMKEGARRIVYQFNQIEKLYASAGHKKVWDHFTKNQRKYITAWNKSSMVGGA